MLIFMLFININFYQILKSLNFYIFADYCLRKTCDESAGVGKHKRSSIQQSCDCAGKANYHVVLAVVIAIFKRFVIVIVISCVKES